MSSLASTKINTLDYGIISMVVYVILFSYAYANSYYRKKILSFDFTNHKKSFTLEQAIFKSEKVFVLIALSVYAGLLIAIFYEQNFQCQGVLGVITILFPVFFVILLLLFLYAGGKRVSYVHRVYAIAVFTGGTILSFMLLKLYRDQFDSNDLTELAVCAYSLLGLVVIISIMYFVRYWFRLKGVFIDILSVFQILHLLMFGITMVVLSSYGKLPGCVPLSSS